MAYDSGCTLIKTSLSYRSAGSGILFIHTVSHHFSAPCIMDTFPGVKRQESHVKMRRRWVINLQGAGQSPDG